jgi:P27 family predicted phage terminase small subunit
MSKRGARPKPTALRILHGDRRDRINTREPRVPTPSKTPPVFADMTKAGKDVWRRLAPKLHRVGVLTEVDRDAFRGYCEAVARRDQAAPLLAAGLLIRGRDGNLVTNPAWRIYRDADAAVRKWASEFGLTPSSRSSITMPDEGSEDDLARLLLSDAGR